MMISYRVEEIEEIEGKVLEPDVDWMAQQVQNLLKFRNFMTKCTRSKAIISSPRHQEVLILLRAYHVEGRNLNMIQRLLWRRKTSIIYTTIDLCTFSLCPRCRAKARVDGPGVFFVHTAIIKVSDFGGNASLTLAYINVDLRIGPIWVATCIHDIHLLLERRWIHKHLAVPPGITSVWKSSGEARKYLKMHLKPLFRKMKLNLLRQHSLTSFLRTRSNSCSTLRCDMQNGEKGWWESLYLQ